MSPQGIGVNEQKQILVRFLNDINPCHFKTLKRWISYSKVAYDFSFTIAYPVVGRMVRTKIVHVLIALSSSSVLCSLVFECIWKFHIILVVY